MDVNHLYFEHQLSLMRAEAATDQPTRIRHRAAAGRVARRIEAFQLGIGASAGRTWYLESEQ